MHTPLRPKWISFLGTKYTTGDFVAIGWHQDDLLMFGKIDFIAVVEDKPLLCVFKYRTYGFDHCYLIEELSQIHVSVWLEDLVDHQPFNSFP